jgi:site-specific recombinase XerD
MNLKMVFNVLSDGFPMRGSQVDGAKEIQIVEEDDFETIPDFEIVERGRDDYFPPCRRRRTWMPPWSPGSGRRWPTATPARTRSTPTATRCGCGSPGAWSAAVHPGEVSQGDVETFRAELVAAGMAATTVAKKLSIIGRFYGAAVEDGYLQINPAKGIKPPQDRRATDKKKHLVRSEMQRLLDAIPDDDAIESLRDRAIVALEMIEGWRRVEIHRACVEDIEAESHEGYRILVHGKIKDGFSYPEDAVVAVLHEYLAARGPVAKDVQTIHNKEVAVTPMICALSKTGRSTRRLSRRGINFVLDKYLMISGLKKTGISNHALRHTCGYNDYNEGRICDAPRRSCGMPILRRRRSMRPPTGNGIGRR